MGAVKKAFSGPPKPPDPPPPPPPPAPIPEPKQPEVKKQLVDARERVARRAVVAQNRDDDIHTSPLGLPSRMSAGRSSLLGR